MSAEPKPAAELSALARSGRGLRVRFYRDGDRYRHVVDAIVDGRVTPFLESVEGDATQHWPPSPPFQDLQVRALDDGKQIILLTGVGGRSHWSASVEVTAEIVTDFPASAFSSRFERRGQIEGPQYLQFDVACRVREDWKFVGSTYRPAADAICGLVAQFGFAGDGRNAFIFGPNPSSLSDCIVAEDRGKDGNAILAICPTDDHVGTAPATIRWKYCMVWST